MLLNFKYFQEAKEDWSEFTLKTSLKTKAFSALMVLLISLLAVGCLGQDFLSNFYASSIQLKQIEGFEATLADPLRVAIECANGSRSRDILGDDPVYSMQNLFESHGFETSIVNGSNIDTVEELNNYDVVVIGDSGSNDNDFPVFQSALEDWVQNGSGVVATGWTIFGMPADEDLDQLLPVSPPYDYETSGNVTMISDNNGSIAQGVDPFSIYDNVEFPKSHKADPGATVLAVTLSTGSTNLTSPAEPMPVAVSWSYMLGRAVYLGPIYFADFQTYENEGLYTDVDAVRLLLNAVEWAAGHTPKTIEAECFILSNNYADTCALDFTLKIPDVDFAWMDISTETPAFLNMSAFDVVLLFEDGLLANATNVGSAVYDFVMAGGNLVIGTFYEQDRSDITAHTPYGWGPLETIDPFTSDGQGCEYTNDTLDVSSVITHPITSGVQSLWCHSYHGGVSAKADTVVVANWTSANYLGEDCPLAGYRILENGQRAVQISVYPNYAYYNTSGDAIGGDFYTLWANAIKWVSSAFYTGPRISKELMQISTGNHEDAPSIALDHNGNLHIVWVGNNSANLYYTMVDDYGDVLINETCLDPSRNATSLHVRRPSIRIDSNNNAHIVFHAKNIYEPWPNYTDSIELDKQEVVYLKINPYLDDMNGNSANYTEITIIPENIISTDDGNKSRAANVAVDSEDNVHVVWFDKGRRWDIPFELHYLVMNQTGGIVISETNVTAGFLTDVDWSEPEIVVDSQGNAHVFFVTENWTGYSRNWRDIYYTMIDGSTGNVLINNTQLTDSNQTWRYSRPFVDIDSEDKIHIAWHDSRFYSNGTGEHEIFYMKIDPYLDDRNGDSAVPDAIKTDEMLITENNNVTSYLANIAVDRQGMAHIVWVDAWVKGQYTDIYLALVDASGNIANPRYRVTHANGTLDFGAWYQSSGRNPEIVVANGRVFIVDMARNLDMDYYDVWMTIVFVDKTPPSTSINYTAYTSEAKDWLSAESLISLLAVDDESNVSATYYNIDYGPWQTYDQPFNLSGLDDGPHTIQFYSVDYFGNEESVKNQAVYLDSTAPNISTPIHYPIGDIEIGQEVMIFVNIADSGSGVEETLLEYSLDNGTNWIIAEMDYNSSSGFYEGTIPAQSTNMSIIYKISANDNVDNNAVQDNHGLYYSYQVIPEFQSIMLIVIFMLTSLLTTILIKKRGNTLST